MDSEIMTSLFMAACTNMKIKAKQKKRIISGDYGSED